MEEIPSYITQPSFVVTVVVQCIVFSRVNAFETHISIIMIIIIMIMIIIIQIIIMIVVHIIIIAIVNTMTISRSRPGKTVYCGNFVHNIILDTSGNIFAGNQ